MRFGGEFFHLLSFLVLECLLQSFSSFLVFKLKSKSVRACNSLKRNPVAPQDEASLRGCSEC